MASEVQICNLALSHIGAYTIESLENPRTTITRACALHYEPTRDAVLSDHAWGFANKHKILALVSGVEISGWVYVYAYPTDCQVARKIYDDTAAVTGTSLDIATGQYTPTGKIEFQIEVADGLDKKYIVTNKEDAELIYTARVVTPNLFDSPFIKALSYALAIELTQPLKADKALKGQLEDEYVRLINRAKAISANEEYKKPDDTNDYVNSR